MNDLIVVLIMFSILTMIGMFGYWLTWRRPDEWRIVQRWVNECQLNTETWGQNIPTAVPLIIVGEMCGNRKRIRVVTCPAGRYRPKQSHAWREANLWLTDPSNDRVQLRVVK